jgi:hypothetical protein
MLSDEDNSGLLTFMVGIAVVVFCGIGLSIVIDQRLSSSNSVMSLEKSIERGRLEFEELQTLHADSLRRLEMIETKSLSVTAELAAIRGEAAVLETRLVSLDSTRRSLQSTIETLEKEYSRYRDEYRETTRDAAINQSLGTLTTLGGRQYHQVFITRVTEVGLEIRHKDGLARIKAADLEQSLKDRFQWNELDQEVVSNNDIPMPEPLSLSNQIPEENGNPSRKSNETVMVPDEVEILRKNVIAWQSRLSRLESERSIALAASHGSRKAPTGSLETWEMRATRLETQIAGVHGKLAAAKASLRVVAPNDPLLRSAAGRH